MATDSADGRGLTVDDPGAVVLALVSALIFGAGGLALGFVLTIIAGAVFVSITGNISAAAGLVLGLVFVQGVGCAGVALTYPGIRKRIGGPIAEELGVHRDDDTDPPSSRRRVESDDDWTDGRSDPGRFDRADRSENTPADAAFGDQQSDTASTDDWDTATKASPVADDGQATKRSDGTFGSGNRLLAFGGDGTFGIPAAVPDLRDIGAIVGGYVAAFGGVIVVALVVTSLLNPDTGTNQAAEIGMENPDTLLLLIPASILLIGPGEELLFRGVVQGRLREVFHPYAAVVIAAAFFAGLHFTALAGGTLRGNIIALGILTVPAMVFGAAYEYTENIVVPSLIHGLYNATLFSLLYVTVRYADQFDPEGMNEAAAALATLV